jgi:hypothetical protein
MPPGEESQHKRLLQNLWIQMRSPGKVQPSDCIRVEENAVGFRCSLALTAISSFVRV